MKQPTLKFTRSVQTTAQPVENKKKNMLIGVVVLIVIVVVLVVAVIALLPNNLGSSSQTNQVQVQVSYSGSWSGAYATTSSTVSWSGTGDKTITVTRPSGTNGAIFIVSANAQKQDSSSGTLTISILNMDGTVLQTADTNTAYGVAQISVNVDSFLTITSTNEPVLQGTNLKVGDTFTYKLTGVSVLGSVDAVTPDGFSIYNNTDYYQVTITGINGSRVSLNTLWRLLNGTAIASSQTIDISKGIETDPNGFWAIYPSNLNVTDLLHSKGTDGVIVNSTGTNTYSSSTRQTNFWSIEIAFTDMNGEEYNYVYFDRQTGMLTSLTNVFQYNNPGLELIINWQLISSNVWDV
jgi:hypothetical protein